MERTGTGARVSYRVIAPLGQGGMAEVFRAVLERPHGAHKPCVVKRISARHKDDARYRQLFLDEARVSMLLNHPHVVQAFELGEQDGVPFLAMELIDGVSLSALMRAHARQRSSFPLVAALDITCAVARGLAYAHRLTGLDGAPLHLTHRDVSPQNILLSRDGAVKLADFGIATHELRDHQTEGPSTKGKPGYMAPEQGMGARVDGRADVFALGIVLAELLGMQRVGPQSTIWALVSRVDALSRAHPDSDEEVVGLALAMTAPDRDARIGTASEAADRLEAAARRRGPRTDVGALVRAWVDSEEPWLPPAPLPVTQVISPEATWDDPPSILAVLERSSAGERAVEDATPLELDRSGFGGDRATPAAPQTVVGPHGPAPQTVAMRAPDTRAASSRGAAPLVSPLPSPLGVERGLPKPAARPSWSARSTRGWVGAGVALLLVLAGAAVLTRPPAPPPTALLSVMSTPAGAAVFVDDVDRGVVTPAVVELPLGRSARVEVRAPGMLVEPRAGVLVEPDAAHTAVSASFVLWPARVVRVESTPPGATVEAADRRVLGQTPLDLPLMRVTESATLTVSLAGHLSRPLVVATGTRTAASVVLERGRTLEVTSVPDGARVLVDGVAAGSTPVTQLVVPSERAFTLRLERSGYKSWQRKLEPRRLREATFEVTLDELPLLAMPLTAEDRQRAKVLLDERARLVLVLRTERRRLEEAQLAHRRLAGQRQSYVAVTADAEAKVSAAHAAVDEVRAELDQVEGELEEIRARASE